MTEALTFAARLTVAGTLTPSADHDDATAWGITASWSGHEWRICPECDRSALIDAKAKGSKCRQCIQLDPKTGKRTRRPTLVDADTYARAIPDRYGPCQRPGCDRPALAHGACAICQHLLGVPR